MARKFNPDEVIFTLAAEQDDIPIRGNAIVSGDDDFDERVARDIEAQLEEGNVWAWASVKVTASWAGFTGTDYLGGCSYKDEADFRQPGGYFEDMLTEAVKALVSEIEAAGWEVEVAPEDVERAVTREVAA